MRDPKGITIVLCAIFAGLVPGCSGDSPKWQELNYDSHWGPCRSGEVCSLMVSAKNDGMVHRQHTPDDAVNFTMSNQELADLRKLMESQAMLDALDKKCPLVSDFTEHLVVNYADMSKDQQTAGCNDPAYLDLRDMMNSLGSLPVAGSAGGGAGEGGVAGASAIENGGSAGM